MIIRILPIVLLISVCLGNAKAINIDGVNINSPQHISARELDSLVSNYHRIYSDRTLVQHKESIPFLILEAKRLNRNDLVSVCYNILGKKQRDNSMYNKALNSHFKALEFSNTNTLQRIKSNNNIGVVYRRLDKPRLASQYHMDALKLVEDALLQDENDAFLFEKCIALNSIGNINLTLNQATQALVSFRQSLALEIKRKNQLGIAINYNNMGYAYQLLKQDEKALAFYSKSLVANTELDSNLGKTINYNSIGDVYLKRQDYQEAKKMFDKANYYSQKINDTYHTSQTYANLARVNLQLDLLLDAKSYIDTFYKQAVLTQSGSLCYQANTLFSAYYEKKGQSKLALDYYKKAESYNDSIMNEKNARYLNEIQTIYDSQKKEQRIELLTAENKIRHQRMILFIIITIGLVLAVAIGFMDLLRRRKQNAQKYQLLNQQLLRMQMNPHFLFNALGSIQNYMYRNETKKAAGYLNQFASLTRSILEHTTQEFIFLSDEIKTLRNYIELEQMRTNHSFNYHINYDSDLETDLILIPPILIQPFVENAIKHGLRNLEYEGQLSIDFEEIDNILQVTVCDNGHGIQPSESKEKGHRSMSMRIFEKRRKLLAQQLKKDIYFTIENITNEEDGLQGTRVLIQIPLKS